MPQQQQQTTDDNKFLFRDITVGVACPILGFFGFLLNCVSIYVFKINGLDRKNKYFKYLLYKSTVDALFLVVYSTDTLTQFVCFDVLTMRLPASWRLPHMLYVNVYMFALGVTTSVSAMCEVVAALDRLIAIGQLCVTCYKRLSPALVLLVLFLVGALTHLHALFMYQTEYYLRSSGNNETTDNSKVLDNIDKM